MKFFLLTTLLFLAVYFSKAQTFTEDGATAGLNISGTKSGGAVWADFDNDGDLDVMVNTGVYNNSNSYLYQQNSDGTFTNVTNTYIQAMGTGNNCCARSLAWGDLNNDGFIDLIGNTSGRMEIYLNRGTDSSPNFMFGVGSSMTPNMTITSMTNGMNDEGIGVMDYNNDGWLDLVIENDQNGIDIFRNDKTGARGTASTFLTQVTIDATGNLGLPAGNHGSGNQGDYLATGDYNNDGYMDILARKHGNMSDLWTNDQDGTFSVNSNFSEGSSGTNSNKGGVIFCDFDSDGDFDIYWTDAGTNQIWLQTGTNSGNFVASNTRIDTNGQPDLSGISGTINIDGCACGDVDNDGDVDLFLGNDGRSGSGRATGSFLFINNTSSINDIEALSFSYTNINAQVNAEGVNLVDYDNDGDADIYINADNSNNQLWKNDNCDSGGCDFFKVVTQDCIDGTLVTRPVVGATMILKDDGGNIVNAAQDMNSAMGHGAQNPAVLNFSTPDPTATYTLEITFPAKIIAPSSTPTVETYSYDFVPNTLSNDTLILTSVNASDGSTCDFSVLPIELLYFKGTFQDRNVVLKWATATEVNNDYFSIERSNDGRTFYKIVDIQGAGNSTELNEYAYQDSNPLSGWSYYRLKQTDFDGKYTYSQIIVVENIYRNFDFKIFPNPINDEFSLQWNGELIGKGELKIYDLSGHLLRSKSFELENEMPTVTWTKLEFLPSGTYVIEFSLGKMNFGSYKIIKKN